MSCAAKNDLSLEIWAHRCKLMLCSLKKANTLLGCIS